MGEDQNKDKDRNKNDEPKPDANRHSIEDDKQTATVPNPDDYKDDYK